MANAAAPWATTISSMASAFLTGDNAGGEELLLAALDQGAPWDVATAAAQALVEHRAQTSTSGPCVAVGATSARYGAMVETGELSANAAAIEAGSPQDRPSGGDVVRQDLDLPRLDVVVGRDEFVDDPPLTELPGSGGHAVTVRCAVDPHEARCHHMPRPPAPCVRRVHTSMAGDRDW